MKGSRAGAPVPELGDHGGEEAWGRALSQAVYSPGLPGAEWKDLIHSFRVSSGCWRPATTPLPPRRYIYWHFPCAARKRENRPGYFSTGQILSPPMAPRGDRCHGHI